MKNNIIFVTGFFGSPIEETAASIAAERGYSLVSLDREIEKKDGRTILRLCMMNGEHAYRNGEHDAIKRIVSECGGQGTVVSCGDGVLYDEMSRDIILGHSLVITGMDDDAETLWRSASSSDGSYHAFMRFGSDDEKKRAFMDYFERQSELFRNTEREMRQR